jgi:ABC-type phosphate/phosphonate transport system substrate-binding protein
MDPLAAPLSCPCVEGYAQRKYEKLAEYLSERLGRPVHVTFAESFEKALAQIGCKSIDIAIGKDSVVRHDAAAMKLGVTPVAALSGKDGKTTQTGLIVVRSGDKAQTVEDLKGYRILYGTAACDEKFAAARTSLSAAGVELVAPESAETTEACSDGACKIIEWGDSEHAAAVISSYAAPLLEGCGTIKKGDLRVVGETAPVPFITAFVTESLDDATQSTVRQSLLEVGKQAELLAALESLVGFVPIAEGAAIDSKPAASVAKPDPKATSGWPQWRGPNRDARVDYLPLELPEKLTIVWQQPLHRPGLGGVAATEEFVVIGDRDAGNLLDEWRCYSARDGTLQWTQSYPAPGQLDYDNMPRATPLIYEGRVFLLGAFGDLTCAELESGKLVWRMNVLKLFSGDPELVWGIASSPLIVDGKLIVNPGGPAASLVALDPATGGLVWQAPGDRHAYASFIVATFGGVRQIVGYDRTSLGGWDIATGNRLWTLKPPYEGDFNVPTPVAVDGKLLVTSENNGTRLHEFDQAGHIEPEPALITDELTPDVSSPAVAGSRVFCVNGSMVCLDLAHELQPIWIGEDEAFCDSSPLLVSNDRVLAFGRGHELILVDARSDDFRIVSRQQVFEGRGGGEPLAHPALVGSRLYLRGENSLACIDLRADDNAASTGAAE